MQASKNGTLRAMLAKHGAPPQYRDYSLVPAGRLAAVCVLGTPGCPLPPPLPPLGASAHGDPHIRDFAGHKFTYRGRPGSPMALLIAGRGGTSLHLTARLAAWAQHPGATIMDSVTVGHGGARVVVQQHLGAPSAPWRLTAQVVASNGTATALDTRMRSSMVLMGSAAGAPVLQARLAASALRVDVIAGPLRVIIRQGMAKSGAAGYLNVGISVAGVLPKPLGGVLSASYTKAASGRAQAAGMAATLTASVVSSV